MIDLIQSIIILVIALQVLNLSIKLKKLKWLRQDEKAKINRDNLTNTFYAIT